MITARIDIDENNLNQNYDAIINIVNPDFLEVLQKMVEQGLIYNFTIDQ